MDAYEKMQSDLDSKTGAEREKAVKDLSSECICPDCPTYNNCAEAAGELLYCF